MDRIEVKDYNGTPTLFINDEPQFAAMLLTCKNLRYDRTEWFPDPYFEDFNKAGFTLYSVTVQMVSFDAAYDSETDRFPKEKFERLEELKEYIRRVPDARFLLRVYPEPRGENSAWLKKYPEECERTEERAKAPYKTPSYASELWLKDAQRYLYALGEQITQRGLSDNVLGMLVCGGDSGEWVKIGPMEDWAGDYSKPMQQGFSRWLKDTYRTVEALRKAWNDNTVSFEQELVPSPEEQNAVDMYLFKVPEKRQRSIDHYRFLAHRVAYDIDRLCAAAKASLGGNHIAGVFYGYLQEMVWNNGFFGQGEPDADTKHSAAARSGHAGLKEVLASENVDFLCSPYCYGFRGTGGEGGFMSPYESVRIAGKLWISEEDIRTNTWLPDSGYGQAKDTKELIELLKRQFSNILVHQSGAWWCDWAGDHDGSFNKPDVMALFKRLTVLGNHALSLPDRTSAAQVAVVIDAESSFFRTTENNFDIPNWRNRVWGISRMGTPVDYVLLTDVLSGKAREYKMYFMMNTFHLSTDDRKKLKDILECGNKLTLWMYAPAFADDYLLDKSFVEDVTGMKLIMRERFWSDNIFISNFEHPVTKNLPVSTFWGTDTQIGPLFSINDDEAVTLGTAVTQQGRCEPGFAVKMFENHISAYSAAPNVPAGVLRELARFAGVHIYTDEEDVFYASHDYVMLHTVRSGKKHIELPRKANVYEAFSGRAVAKNTNCFTDEIKAGTTSLYYFGESELPDQGIFNKGIV